MTHEQTKEELVRKFKDLTDQVVLFIQALESSETQKDRIEELEEEVRELKEKLSDAENYVQEAKDALDNCDFDT